jgi:2-oxoglutarate ferredoxin oxidoreductase subunit gamma
MKIDAAAPKGELIVAGLGGQGVLVIGELLARAGMSAYAHTSFRPSYGVEARGGTSECAVILSDAEILFPVLSRAHAVIVIDGSQLKAFEEKVRPGGLLIVEKDKATDEAHRDDIEILEIPGAEIARQIGEMRVANLVFLGAYLGKTRLLPLETIEEELGKKLKSEDVRRANREALRQGARIAETGSP